MKNKLKIILPVIVAIVVIAIVGIYMIRSRKTNNMETPKENNYKIGDTISTDDWKFTLTDVQYNKSLKDFIDNKVSEYEAKEGNIYVIVTYNVKYLGKEKERLEHGFELDFNNGYIFENDGSFYSGLFTKDSDSKWRVDLEHSSGYTFNPLEEEQQFREFIQVKEDIISEVDKPLQFIKKLDFFEKNIVKYNLR